LTCQFLEGGGQSTKIYALGGPGEGGLFYEMVGVQKLVIHKSGEVKVRGNEELLAGDLCRLRVGAWLDKEEKAAKSAEKSV